METAAKKFAYPKQQPSNLLETYNTFQRGKNNNKNRTQNPPASYCHSHTPIPRGSTTALLRAEKAENIGAWQLQAGPPTL